MPWAWFAARAGGPALAAALALLYLAQRPLVAGDVGVGHDGAGPSGGAVLPRSVPAAMLRGQARLLLVGLPLAVAVARLVAGPVVPVAKLLVFGLADVAAFHLIHFGVVTRAYAPSARAEGQAVAVLLFGASWGLREALLAGVGGGASIVLAGASGVLLGSVVGGGSRALRRWPGGWWPAAATHWLVVYLVFGFVD